MNTPNHQPTERDRIYDEMVAYRAKLIADFEAIERQHTKNLADLDAVIATLDLRRTPQIGVDRKQCGNCGGWLVAGQGGWVHDRDGQMACKPGHSGPVASPLAQTTAFPAVQPGDATQVIPAVSPHHPFAEYVGLRVAVSLDDSAPFEGLFQMVDEEYFRLWLDQGQYSQPCGIDKISTIRSVEPADAATEVIDRVTANPAAEGGA